MCIPYEALEPNRFTPIKPLMSILLDRRKKHRAPYYAPETSVVSKTTPVQERIERVFIGKLS